MKRSPLELSNTNIQKRHRKARMFRLLCAGVTWLGAALLAILLIQITLDGIKWLDIQFLTSFHPDSLIRPVLSLRWLAPSG